MSDEYRFDDRYVNTHTIKAGGINVIDDININYTIEVMDVTDVIIIVDNVYTNEEAFVIYEAYKKRQVAQLEACIADMKIFIDSTTDNETKSRLMASLHEYMTGSDRRMYQAEQNLNLQLVHVGELQTIISEKVRNCPAWTHGLRYDVFKKSSKGWSRNSLPPSVDKDFHILKKP